MTTLEANCTLYPHTMDVDSAAVPGFVQWDTPMCLVESSLTCTLNTHNVHSNGDHENGVDTGANGGNSPGEDPRPLGGGVRLSVVQETADRLASVRVPVIPVGIAGKYRTGKSYLMNRLAGVQGRFTHLIHSLINTICN